VLIEKLSFKAQFRAGESAPRLMNTIQTVCRLICISVLHNWAETISR
jgi:hypothetical protein